MGKRELLYVHFRFGGRHWRASRLDEPGRLHRPGWGGTFGRASRLAESSRLAQPGWSGQLRRTSWRPLDLAALEALGLVTTEDETNNLVYKLKRGP